jgi:osmotically-inducible protein OsmY
MQTQLKAIVLNSLLCFALPLSWVIAQAQQTQQAQQAPGFDEQETRRIAEEVRREIVTLPQYGVFDHIYYGIQGRNVILMGEASRPTLKSGAENVVKRIEGVQGVENRIEVLPLSPNDDRIRLATYVNIYSHPALQKYTSNRGGIARWRPSVARRAGGITNDPPIGFHAIHIIVRNGHTTLRGVVLNSGDSTIAEVQANTVPGVFSVTNALEIETQPSQSTPAAPGSTSR